MTLAKRATGATAAVLVLILFGAGAVLVLSIGSSSAACAAPPLGWHQTVSISGLVTLFGPTLLVFFVGGYLALGIRHPLGRFLAFCIVIALSLFTLTVTAALMPMSCGQWAP